jgi:hypothetical protein
MNTEPVPLSHPAACPYCNGKVVNQVQPDYLLRHAALNDDGTITVGDVVEGVDFDGPCLLFCHGCSSTYVQPGDVKEVSDDTLEVLYPASVKPGDPAYQGMTVAWTPSPGEPITLPEHAVARG